MTTLMTSREFNQRTEAAKRAALDGPVTVADRGEPKHVLLSYSDYLELGARPKTLLDLFAALPDSSDIDLPLPGRQIEQPRSLGLD
jgi:prevent-host-death family protein